jgi:uncharacterized protein (DUF927 family)
MGMNVTELVPRFHLLFAGSSKSHGVYVPPVDQMAGKEKGNATTEPGPATAEIWQAHLDGKTGLGVCPVLDDGTCTWGAVDIDVYDGLNHGQMAALLVGHGLPALSARSRSGGVHVYVLAKEPVPADRMVARLGEIARVLGHPSAEIFPKQTAPTLFGGNWVNMPYFGGDKTTRYAVNANGDAHSPEGFLDAADGLKAGPEWFSTPLALATTPDPGTPKAGRKKGFTLPDEIGEGGRDRALTSAAGKLRRAGFSVDEILAALRQTNQERCKPPMDDSDVVRIARSVARYAPASEDDYGFSLDETGVFHRDKSKTDKSGNPLQPLLVCGPLSVDAYARTTASRTWSLLVTFTNRDGQREEMLLSDGSLDAPGNQWVVPLRDAGLRVADKTLLRRYLETRDVNKRVRLVDRVGWTNDYSVFMLPSGPVPRLSGEEWVYKGNDRVLFGTKGTLDEWRANMAKYCVGNSRLTFAVSAAFLAPLLPLLGANEGRAFHIFHDSSSGKTTCLQVAGSVCGGGGKLGFLQTWNSTGNAMEGIAAAHNHSILLLDELGEMDSRKAGQLAYVIVGGQGKARLNRSAEMRESLSWLNVVFSTGEISLERHMKAGDSDARLMGGQEVRIVSIPADTESGHGVFETLYGFSAGGFADMLKRASNSYYGTPLLAWLEGLAARRDELVTRARKAADDFKAKHARVAGPQVGRVAESFALVAAAGTLATEEGITGWPPGAAAEGAGKCFAAWLKERGTEGSSDEASILKQVRRFYQLHGDSRFKKLEADERIVINQAGYLADGEFWTFDQVFESEVCKGFEPKQVARALAKNGHLVTDEKGRFKSKRTSKRTYTKVRPDRFYVIRQDSIFGDERQLPLAA